MRSSLVIRASDCQCTSCNGPGLDLSIRRHSGIWGAADEAMLNIVRTKRKKSPPKNITNIRESSVSVSEFKNIVTNCKAKARVLNYFMEDHAFSLSDDSAPTPPTPLLMSASCLSVSRRPSLLTGVGEGGGVGRSQIIRWWEGRVLYKYFQAHVNITLAQIDPSSANIGSLLPCLFPLLVILLYCVSGRQHPPCVCWFEDPVE